jgi:asparagine synthase (glutamine-hydrolysing)
VYDRPKMGFSFPWHQWLQSDLKDFCYQRLQKLMQYPMFNATEIERYWQRFIYNHSDVSWVNIWQLVILGNWLEVNEF